MTTPHHLAHGRQTHSHHMYDSMYANVVKVSAFNSEGILVGEASGFCYTNELASMQPIITSTIAENSGWACALPGPVIYHIEYHDGSECEAHVHAHTEDSEGDFMILEASARRPNSSNSTRSSGRQDSSSSTATVARTIDIVRGADCRSGDHVYVFGCRQGSYHVHMTTGVVATSSSYNHTVTAVAEKTFVGGPVINTEGRLVGVITSAEVPGFIRIDPVAKVHALLFRHDMPGLL